MDLIERIDALIADRHLLSHPFYTRWREGTLPVEAIQEYTRQYYAFESAFPRLLSALHSRTDDPAVRQSILDNLWDEEHGEVNHAEMWLRFAEGMGVERDEVRGAEPNEGTRALMETYWGLATDGVPASGIAAFYAYESQVPAVSVEKIEGLKSRYGIDDPADAGVLHRPLHPRPGALGRRARRDLVERRPTRRGPMPRWPRRRRHSTRGGASSTR